MKKLIYQMHLILGALVSVPVLAWAVSGLMYALPNTIEGGSVEKIEASFVRITPAEAMLQANALAGRQLPTTALTLLMHNGHPEYQSVGGLGADSIFIDARTGDARLAESPTLKTRFFREAHFYFFAGEWQVALLIVLSGLAALSALTGVYLNIAYWSRRLRRTRA